MATKTATPLPMSSRALVIGKNDPVDAKTSVLNAGIEVDTDKVCFLHN